MKRRWIVPLLVLAGMSLAQTPEEELKFAQMLGRRGLDEMALELLDRLENSGDPKAQRYGRFGKAALTKDRATVAKARFLRALEEGRTPELKRQAVIDLYEQAKPAIEAYVKERPDDFDARFLFGELLQEYGEFLAGAEYPETMTAEVTKLVSENSAKAEQLFEEAINQFGAVADKLRKKFDDMWDKGLDPASDPDFVQYSLAGYRKAKAWMRLALLYPGGPRFINRSETAVEVLDEFYNVHYEDAFGAQAMLDLGELYYERAMRLGNSDDADISINYLQTLYTGVEEQADIPELSAILAKAYYWHNRMCIARAKGDGALKKAEPIFLENVLRAEASQRQRLKQGADNPWALRALLLAAEAHAMQGGIDGAVEIAGEVLARGRVKGYIPISQQATGKLTEWVAQVSGAGGLDGGLLFQIGESLSSQGQVTNAITFFEQAVAASTTEDEKSRVAYPARLRIAQTYFRDQRFYVSADVAWGIVDEFLKTGAEEESALEQVASEACNVARLCWKTISDFTGRPADRSRFESVRATFRSKFPMHPENSDAAFSQAMELFNAKKFAEAAEKFVEINPASSNYWRAQRLVPVCYRQLASDAEKKKDEAEAKQWHTKCLESSLALIKLGRTKGDDPAAQRSVQQGELYEAMSLASHGRWADALRKIDAYLKSYPGVFLKKGLEYAIKIDAHIELARPEDPKAEGAKLDLDQLADAEATLAEFRKELPDSPYVDACIYKVFDALRDAYKQMGGGKQAHEVAARAADLLAAWINKQERVDGGLLYVLGDVMRDAQRWQEAGDAFEAAAGRVSDPAQQRALTLRAAEMKYKAAREAQASGTVSPVQYKKILEDARVQYTDALIEKKDLQEKLLQTLGNPEKWLSKEEWNEIKRNPNALLAAAEIYSESSPPGVDGRWVAIRLVQHMHTFTSPVTDPQRPQLDEYIPLWWDGAQFMLETYLAIALSGRGKWEKKAASDGYAMSQKLIFQYVNMDGEERVQAIKALDAKLKTLR